MNNAQSANLIKNICKEKKVPISRLLADCGIRKSLIYDMEKRDFTPSVSIFEKIANYLNVSVDYLLGKTDEKNKPTGVSADELDEALKRVSEIASTLSEEEKQMWIEFGEMLLRSQNNPRKQ